jgi:hypothetical protein
MGSGVDPVGGASRPQQAQRAGAAHRVREAPPAEVLQDKGKPELALKPRASVEAQKERILAEKAELCGLIVLHGTKQPFSH